MNTAGIGLDTLRAGTAGNDRGAQEDGTGIDVSERLGGQARPVRTEGLGR